MLFRKLEILFSFS